MAKAISSANTNLLNARVVRADGTKTFINKVNARGYSTDAKGPQIPMLRLVQSGRTLKEIPEAYDKAACIVSDGIVFKLNRKQQRQLADNEIDNKEFRVDLDRLQFVTDAPTKVQRMAVRHTPKAESVKADKRPTAKRVRKQAKAEGIEVDMLTKKTQTASRKNKKEKDVPADFIKQMPREIKRLIQDGEFKLNRKQIEAVLSALGVDSAFYAVAVERYLDGMSLRLPQQDKPKAGKRSKAITPVYADQREYKKLFRKLKTKVVVPTKKFEAQHKQKVREVRKFWQEVLGLSSPSDIKKGLMVIDDYGDKLMLVTIDQVSTIFVKADGSGERLMAHALLNQKSGHGKFTLAPADELDASA